MKKMILFTIFVLLTTITVACSNDSDKDKENDKDKNETENVENNNEQDKDSNDEESALSFEELDVDVVATVNGEDISKDELIQNEQYLVDQYEMMGMPIAGSEGQIRETALNQLINTKLVVQNAIDEGLVPSDEEIEEEYQSLIDELKSYYETDDVSEVFEQFDTNEEEVKSDIRTDLITNKFLEANLKVEEVSDEELQQAYDDYVAQMEQAEQEAESLENVRELLKQQLTDQKQSDAQRELIDRLRENSEIEVLI
ncbi:SurA N-terminal domain-containing protein [Bacillaceae bacterium W0354]